VEGVASAGVLDVSRADGILANTAAPTVCITSDLPVILPEHCLRSDTFTPEKRIAEWPSMQKLASPIKSEMVLVAR